MAIERYNIKRMIMAGGVSASKYLRSEMQKMCDELNVDLSVPPIKYCTDNAAMIACAAYPQFIKKDFVDLDLKAESQVDLFGE